MYTYDVRPASPNHAACYRRLHSPLGWAWAGVTPTPPFQGRGAVAELGPVRKRRPTGRELVGFTLIVPIGLR